MIKKGFTLAEVLITLGIIGVVAAMTMPTLIQSANDAKIGPELANAVSTLGNAIDNFMQDNNATSLQVALLKENSENSANDLIKILTGKYVRSSGIIPPDKKVSKLGDEKTEITFGAASTANAMLLGNKSILAAETTSCKIEATETSHCGIIFYTSGYGNSLKEKLMAGRDIFKLVVTDKGEVIPFGSPGSGANSTEAADCVSKGKATTCAGKIAAAGWKKDY